VDLWELTDMFVSNGMGALDFPRRSRLSWPAFSAGSARLRFSIVSWGTVQHSYPEHSCRMIPRPCCHSPIALYQYATRGQTLQMGVEELQSPGEPRPMGW